jgi:hypothetical protein
MKKLTVELLLEATKTKPDDILAHPITAYWDTAENWAAEIIEMDYADEQIEERGFDTVEEIMIADFSSLEDITDEVKIGKIILKDDIAEVCDDN